jgi:hypothetical protein
MGTRNRVGIGLSYRLGRLNTTTTSQNVYFRKYIFSIYMIFSTKKRNSTDRNGTLIKCVIESDFFGIKNKMSTG